MNMYQQTSFYWVLLHQETFIHVMILFFLPQILTSSMDTTLHVLRLWCYLQVVSPQIRPWSYSQGGLTSWYFWYVETLKRSVTVIDWKFLSVKIKVFWTLVGRNGLGLFIKGEPFWTQGGKGWWTCWPQRTSGKLAKHLVL